METASRYTRSGTTRSVDTSQAQPAIAQAKYSAVQVLSSMIKIALSCAMCHVALAQEKSPPKPPVYVLAISGEDPIAANLPSPMLEGAIGCTADGSLVVNSILESDPTKPVPFNTPELLSTISTAGKVNTFNLSAISDVQGFSDARSYDVGDHDVDFLIYGTRKQSPLNASVNASIQPPLKSQWFVAQFDRQGIYHGSTELALPQLAPQKLAASDSGDFLVFGIDEANHEAKLIRYAPIGQEIFYYQPDTDFAKKNDTLPSAFAKGSNPDKDRVSLSKLQGAIQFSQFVHFKDSIFLLQMNANSPLFQVFANGSIRTVHLPALAGFSADSIVPSDDLLYIRYRRVGTNTGRGEDGLILELNPDTGDILRRIRPGDFTIWDAACVHRGVFRIVKLKGERTFQIFQAAPATEAGNPKTP